MRACQELTFPTHDEQQLFYRQWLPRGPVKRAVFLFHRGHEHSGRMQLLVDGLAMDDYAFFAWDARGHGRSPGRRGAARHLMDLVRDVECFVRHVRAEHGLAEEDVAVVAHSVAAVVVGLWVHDYAPRIRAMVLATPALSVKLYVPFARQGLTALQAVCQATGQPTPPIRSYVTGSWLSHDREQASLYDRDPLVSREIAVNVLLGLHQGARRLGADAGALVTPTLVLCARRDWVVKNGAARRLFGRLGTRFKEIRAYRDYFHSLFHETGRHRVYADVRTFLEDAFMRDLERGYLVQNDRWGHSCEEHEFLKAGLPVLHPKRWAYAATRLVMGTVGRLSRGLRLGLRTGFGSGQTLDYVYRNTPSGWTPLGRLVDHVYLQSLGWRCIRVRRRHLQELVLEAARQCPSDRPVRVLDLAGGPGRYLLELAQENPDVQWDLRIRDCNEESLQEGRELARQWGLTGVIHERGDAFSEESLAALGPVDVAVVSGLFELYPHNVPVWNSLRALARVARCLVYTNQPWHPQIELIAELLTDRGQPWVMRRRSQAEMDELVRTAGFSEKKAARIDDEGIFTVSLARRP